VPEKAQKQFNFCLLPSTGTENAAEPIIWTVNDGPLKSCSIPSAQLQEVASSTNRVLEDVLQFVMQRTGVEMTYPDDKEFASATPESHRKSDKAYHVKAHRGSKEGIWTGTACLTAANRDRLSLFPRQRDILWLQETSVVLRFR